jgi:hypothetical protein
MAELIAAERLGIRVQAEQDSPVPKRVLVLGPRAFVYLGIRGTDYRLNLRAVDQTGDIWVRDFCSWQEIVLLVYSSLIKGAKDIVKESERSLSPDDKAADMSTRCELEKIETTDIDELDTRQVAECLHDATVFIVDYERTAALAMATVAQLSLTGAKLARVGDLYDVAVRTKGLEKRNCLLCLVEGLNGITNDEGNLLDLLNAVAASEDERRKRRGGKRRNSGKAALVLVHLNVPFAPGLRRREHATTTTHVTEGGLARAVSASTTDTGNTCDGTTSTPRLGRSLMASLFTDGISLTLVLRNALVDLLNDIKTNRSGQNRGKRERRGSLACR